MPYHPLLLEMVRTRPGMFVYPFPPIASLLPASPTHASLDIQLVGPEIIIDYDGPLPFSLFPPDAPSRIEQTLAKPPRESRPHEFVHDLSVCAAASTRLTLDEHIDGSHIRATFSKGILTIPPARIAPSSKTGLRLSLLPDSELLPLFATPWHPLCGQLNELAVARAPVAIHLHDTEANRTRTFHYPDGPKNYLAELTRSESGIIQLERRVGDDVITIAVQLSLNGPPLLLETFVNDRRTIVGGSHNDAFKRACHHLAKEHQSGLLWRDIFLKPDSLSCVITILSPNPGWSGPLHKSIENQKLGDAVFSLSLDALTRIIDNFKRHTAQNKK